MKLSLQFAKKVDYVVDEKTNCWNARKMDNGEGYAYQEFKIDEKVRKIGVHRVSYMVFIGEIPKGHCIMHKCDNRRCVNPDHLVAGTKKQNSEDMVAKGRQSLWKGLPRQSLTIQQIRDIRSSDLSSYKLADIYPVSSTQIRRIRNGSRCADIR